MPDSHQRQSRVACRRLHRMTRKRNAWRTQIRAMRGSAFPGAQNGPCAGGRMSRWTSVTTKATNHRRKRIVASGGFYTTFPSASTRRPKRSGGTEEIRRIRARLPSAPSPAAETSVSGGGEQDEKQALLEQRSMSSSSSSRLRTPKMVARN